MSNITFEYVTYIATTPEKLWEALTSGDYTKQYWFGHEIKSDWTEGSSVVFLDKFDNIVDKGQVIHFEPSKLLSYTFEWVQDTTKREVSPIVTFTLREMDIIVKLSLKHEELLPSDIYEENDNFQGINNGWPAILSNLKSLLETGEPLPSITV
ncbi:SRPBCC domain-containing protein [Psychrobacillus sp. FJAT-51614]|uniref:SRPBCC domain-containing protein n=1 Tax=Psychrobacillus mangrovi TaxID=3117745 RepID=A0ABU8F675_9BACI